MPHHRPQVPATAEIVLEGRIIPEITAPDGPFGEYHGYNGPPHRVPVFEVSAVTHRKDPIYLKLHAASDIKTAIIVNDDIDPFDWDAVNWALSTRFNPAVDGEIMTGLPENPLDQAMPKRRGVQSQPDLEDHPRRHETADRAAPRHLPDYPDVMEAARKNWARYGFGRAVGATRGSGDTPDVSAEP